MKKFNKLSKSISLSIFFIFLFMFFPSFNVFAEEITCEYKSTVGGDNNFLGAQNDYGTLNYKKLVNKNVHISEKITLNISLGKKENNIYVNELYGNKPYILGYKGEDTSIVNEQGLINSELKVPKENAIFNVNDINPNDKTKQYLCPNKVIVSYFCDNNNTVPDNNEVCNDKKLYTYVFVGTEESTLADSKLVNGNYTGNFLHFTGDDKLPVAIGKNFSGDYEHITRIEYKRDIPDKLTKDSEDYTKCCTAANDLNAPGIVGTLGNTNARTQECEVTYGPLYWIDACDNKDTASIRYTIDNKEYTPKSTVIPKYRLMYYRETGYKDGPKQLYNLTVPGYKLEGYYTDKSLKTKLEKYEGSMENIDIIYAKLEKHEEFVIPTPTTNATNNGTSIKADTTYVSESGTNLMVRTWLQYATQDGGKYNNLNNGWYLNRKYLTNGKANQLNVYRFVTITNGKIQNLNDNGGYLKPSGGTSKEGTYQIQNGEEASRNNDLDDRIHVCFYKTNKGNAAMDIFAGNTGDNSEIQAFKNACATFSEGVYELLYKSKTDVEEYSDSKKINCIVDDNSYIKFRLNTNPLDFYVEDVKGISELELTLNIDTYSDMHQLIKGGGPNDIAPLSGRKISALKEIGIEVLATIAIAIPTAGIGGVVGAVIKVTLKTLKFVFIAKGALAGANELAGVDMVRIVDCGANGTCGTWGDIAVSGSTVETFQCTYSIEEMPDKPKYDLDKIECSDIKKTKFYRILQYILKLLRIIACGLLVVFGILDFVKPIISGDSEMLQKSGSVFVKRLILTVLIFFVPAIVDLLVSLMNITSCS